MPEVILLIIGLLAILAICLQPDHPRQDRPEDQDEAGDGTPGEVAHVPLPA